MMSKTGCKRWMFLPGMMAMLVLLPALTAMAGQVTIPNSDYHFVAPAGYTTMRPANAPDILIQANDPAGTVAIQVLKGGANLPGESVAPLYEQVMRQALPNLRQLSSGQIVMNGRQTLYRTYHASSQGTNVTIHAAFYADDKAGFIFSALDGGNQADAIVAAYRSFKDGAEAAARAIVPTSQPAMAMTRRAFPDLELSVEIPRDWQAEKTSSHQTFGGAQGTPAYHTTVSVQALDRGQPQNRDLAAAVASFSRGLRGQGANITASRQRPLSGMAGRIIDARVALNGENFVFRYVLLERSKVVAVLSFVAPQSQWAGYESLAEQMIVSLQPAAGRAAHMAQTTPPATPDVSAPAAPAAAPPSFTLPATSRDVYLTLHKAVLAGNWAVVMELFNPDYIDKQMTTGWWSSIVQDEGLTAKVAGLSPKQAAVALFQNSATARDSMSYLARDGEVYDIRKENDRLQLVKVRHSSRSGDEHYFWMKKVGGKWLFFP